MGSIVCAMRGGAGSRAVHLRAMELARESGQRVIFLYVIDLSGFKHNDVSLLPAIRQELWWLGHTLLQIGCQRAKSEGIDAEMAVREGAVREEILRFLTEVSAEVLLLGAPRAITSAVFGDDPIEQFAAAIASQSGVKVEVVHPEDYADSHE